MCLIEGSLRLLVVRVSFLYSKFRDDNESNDSYKTTQVTQEHCRTSCLGLIYNCLELSALVLWEASQGPKTLCCPGNLVL